MRSSNIDDVELEALAGDPEAMHHLGQFYYWGRHGKPIDRRIAFEWFARSAEAGDPEGMLLLGLMLEDGVTVPRDIVEAYKWYLLAWVHGGEKYGVAVGATRPVLSDAEYGHAIGSARAWLRAHGKPADALPEVVVESQEMRVRGTGRRRRKS
jgi:TPR repeat protein